MTTARIVFAATPEFSVPCLKGLINRDVNLVGVYTQPDRRAGRGKKLQQSPVKQCALDAGLSVFQPASLKSEKARQTLAELQPDLIIVVAYGLILPASVLGLPRLGGVNVHASLLPRWRGAAPIQRAIEAGDRQTGVCLMQMEQGLDTGPVLACRRHTIGQHETGGQLHDTLSVMGADLLDSELENILNQRLTPVRQPEQGVSYAPKLSKSETQVDWSMRAEDIANKIRAFNPWPVMSTRLGDQLIRIYQAVGEPAPAVEQHRYTAGQILHAAADGIRVATGSGTLNIEQLQKPGGRVLSARDFLNGFTLRPGQRFEPGRRVD